MLYHLLTTLSRLHDDDNRDVEAELKASTTVLHDLCLLLLEYYGTHLAQPRRDLFQKAIGRLVTPADQSVGSLTTGGRLCDGVCETTESYEEA